VEPFARSLLSVLLAFLDARVARQEAGLLQPLPQLDVVFHEGAGDPEPQRAGLAGDSSAADRGQHIKLIGRFGDRLRLLDLGAERLGGEGLFDRLLVHRHAAGAGPEEHACGGSLAAAGAVILNP
jgi:hypothetical protein